jgi:hypothetical protein
MEIYACLVYMPGYRLCGLVVGGPGFDSRRY